MTEGLSNDALGELIDVELNCDATTSNGLTNHLPMALVAKAGLGASRAELERFMKKYRRRLVATDEADRHLTRATWRSAVGEANAYADLVDYFDREIDEHGIEETVRNHLDDLVDGVSGAAFHGVIRLAYALDVASSPRVARGLAYLASTAMTLGPLDSGAATSDDPESLLGDLARDTSWHTDDSVGNITARMRFVAGQPQFTSVASSLSVDDETPARLAAAALRLYASTDDFTALHGVTGLEAISRLRPYVSDVERLDRATFQALAAAYLSIGSPAIWSASRLSELVDTSTHDQFDVAARAGISDDEHVAKIVFSSRRLNVATSDPLYLAVAERAVMNDETVADRRRDC
jgi:Questin oxidase-like